MGFQLIKNAPVCWVCIAFVMTLMIVTPRTSAIGPAEALIAFSSDRDETVNIYTMLPDGSNVRRITSGEGSEYRPTWSPDGTQIAYIYRTPGRSDLYVMDANGRNARLIGDDERIKTNITWSPDGTQIGFTWYEEGVEGFSIITLDSGEIQSLPDVEAVGSPSWSPDGTKILYTRSSEDSGFDLFIYDLDNEEEIQLTDDEISQTYPEWSPDGTQILFTSQTRDTEGNITFDLYTISVDGSDQVLLLEDGQSGIWSPDGSEIAFTRRENDGGVNIYIMDADGSNVRQITTAGDIVGSFSWQPVQSDEETGDEQAGGSQAIEPSTNPANEDRKIVFASDRGGSVDLYTMNLDGSDLEQLTDSSAIESTPIWSPDGTKIVFSMLDRSDGDLYMIDADGGNLEQLTSNPAEEYNPSWSPDGTRIVFASDRDGDLALYVLTLESGVIRRLIRGEGSQADPAWSPDGTQIAFISNDNGDIDLYVVDADGTNIRQITDDRQREGYPRWSPDSRQIAFQVAAPGELISETFEVYIIDADGDNKQRLTDNENYDGLPVWSPDGTQLLITSNPDGEASNIYLIDADGRNARAITDSDSYSGQADWQPAAAIEVPTESTSTAGGEELIVFTGEVDRTFELYTVRPDGSDVQRLTDNDLIETSVAWSPDGTQLVFEGREDFEDAYDIYVMDVDGTNVRQLTDTPDENEEFPAWSPDGTQIAFESDARGSSHIYIMDADGSNVDQLTRGSSDNITVSWTPDGSQLMFSSNREGSYNVYLMNPDGSDLTQITDDVRSSLYPRLSPDGTEIVFTRVAGEQYDLYVMDADGTNRERLYSDDNLQVFPNWSPDGSQIIFTSVNEDDSYLYIIDRDGDNARRLVDDPEYVLYGSWSRVAGDTPVVEATETPEETEEPEIDIPDTGCRAVIRENLNLRESPVTGRVILTVPRGTEVPVIARSDNNDWWKIVYNDQQGWVARRFTESKGTCSDLPLEGETVEATPEPTPIPTDDTTCRISSNLVMNMRETPITGEVIFLIPIGQEAEVIARLEDDSWYRVDYRGDEGWVSAVRTDLTGECDAIPVEEVEGLPEATATGTPSVSNDDVCQISGNVVLNVRETPVEGEIVTVILIGEQAEVIARLEDSSWYKVDYRDQQGWVSALLVDTLGDCDNVPVDETAGLPDTDPTETILVTPGPATTVTGTPVPTAAPTEDPTEQVATAAGDLIAFSSNRGGGLYYLYVVRPDGSGLRQIAESESGASTPAWSPDGTKIAFSRNLFGNTDIYVANADGTNVQRITSDSGIDTSPTWSPDGTKIAYTSVTGTFGSYIAVININGRLSKRLSETDNFFDQYPAWSPDGTKIAFISGSQNEGDVYVMDADGDNLTRLTYEGDAITPAWSPDGTKIAFSLRRDGNTDIYTMTDEGRQLERITTSSDTDFDPSWSPDGSEIVYASTSFFSVPHLYVVNVESFDVRRLTDDLGNDLYPDWNPSPNPDAETEDPEATTTATPAATATEAPTTETFTDEAGQFTFDYLSGSTLGGSDEQIMLTQGEHSITVYAPSIHTDVTQGQDFESALEELKFFVERVGYTVVGPETEDTSFGKELAHVSVEFTRDDKKGIAFLVDVGDDNRAVVLWLTPQDQTLSAPMLQTLIKIITTIAYTDPDAEVAVPEATAAPSGPVMTLETSDDTGVLTFEYFRGPTIDVTDEYVVLTEDDASIRVYLPAYYNSVLKGRVIVNARRELRIFLSDIGLTVVGPDVTDTSFDKELAHVAFEEEESDQEGTAFLVDLGNDRYTVVLWMTPLNQNLSDSLVQSHAKIMSSLEYELLEEAHAPVEPTATPATAGISTADISTDEGLLTFDYVSELTLTTIEDGSALIYEADIIMVYSPQAFNAAVEGESFDSPLETLKFFLEEEEIEIVGPETDDTSFAKELAHISVELLGSHGTAFLVDLGDGHTTVVMWFTEEQSLSTPTAQTLVKIMSTIDYEATDEASPPVIPTSGATPAPTEAATATPEPVTSEIRTRIITDEAGQLTFDYLSGVIFDESAVQISLILGRDSITIFKPSTYAAVTADQTFATSEDALTYFLEEMDFELKGSPSGETSFGKALAQVALDLSRLTGTAFLVDVGGEHRAVVIWMTPEGQTLSTAMTQTLFKVMSTIEYDARGESAAPAVTPTATPTTAATTSVPTAEATEQTAAPQTMGQNGLIVFQEGGDLFTIQPDGRAVKQLTPLSHEGAYLLPAWSPDGTQIAYAYNPTGDYDIYVMDADGSNVRQLTDAQGHQTAPAWSPDGTQIVYQSQPRSSTSSLYIMNVDGGNSRRLTNNSFSEGEPDWSPDGTQIVFTGENAGVSDLYVVDVDGQNHVQLTDGAAAERMADWSPDGTRIVYHSDVDGDNEIYLMNRDGSQVRRLTTNKREDYGATWSPDGQFIAFTSNIGGNASLSMLIMGNTGAAPGVRRLTESPGRQLDPAWQPVFVETATEAPTTATEQSPSPQQPAQNGLIVYQAGRDLYTVNPNNLSTQVLKSGSSGMFLDPVWSPDGTQIVYAHNPTGEYDLYVMDVDGSNVRQLTVERGNETAPSWSPDGTQIVYQSVIGDTTTLYVIGADGSNRHRLTQNSFNEFNPDWSPDGTQIVFTGGPDNTSDLYVITLDSQKQMRLTQDEARKEMPDWSPDGMRIVFHTDVDGDNEIYTIGRDGSEMRRLTTNQAEDYGAVWSPDGEYVVYTSKAGSNPNLFLIRFETKGIRRLTDAAGPEINPSWQPMVAETAIEVPTTVTSAAPTATPATPTATPALPTATPEATEEADLPEPVPVIAQNGRIVFVTGSYEYDIYSMEANGRGVQSVTLAFANESDPEWSPDGTQIVYASNAEGQFDIYVMNADGSNERRLTSSEMQESAPAWSPNGKQIVFEMSRDGDVDLYIMSADGTNMRRLWNSPENEFDPSWSPRGDQILFTSYEDGQADLYLINIDGSNLIRLTDSDANERSADWSPDGMEIVYQSDEDGDDEIYVMAVDGSNVRRLTRNDEDDQRATWSPDGQFIVFQSKEFGAGVFFLYQMSASGTGMRRLTEDYMPEMLPDWQPIFSEAEAPTATPTEVVLPTSVPELDPTTADEHGVEVAGTVMDVILSDPDLSTFATSLIAAGLLDELSSANGFQYTVFAPTNDAFDALLNDLDMTRAEFLSDQTLLTRILSYHLLPGKTLSGDLKDGEMTSLNGMPITIKLVGSEIFVNDVPVNQDDLEAGNGVVYVIEEVLLPPDLLE